MSKSKNNACLILSYLILSPGGMIRTGILLCLQDPSEQTLE